MRILLALTLLLLAGCAESPVEQAPVQDLQPPVLDPLALYTSRQDVPVSWSAADSDARYQVQRAEDPEFTINLAESDWIEETTFTFGGLAHGVTYHFRVKARLDDGRESVFSGRQTVTVDSIAPTATVALLAESQTSLLFIIDGQAADDGSGLAGIQLLYLPPEGIWAEVGVFDDFPVSFNATSPGEHAFKAVATDLAGNIQDAELATVRTTIVPEPIIITDLTGEDFDITNAVLRYHIGLGGWAHGLGRDRIRPIIDPDFAFSGEPGFPHHENLADVMAVDFGGQQRAYPIGELANREVVDDTVAGVHLAATY